MPGLQVHRYVDKLLFGHSYWRVHREMDRPYKYLGRYHRIMFHDPLLAYAIARKCYPNDQNAIAAAQCHIALDNMCSRNRGLKRVLEWLARMDKKKKKSLTTTINPQVVRIDKPLDRLRQLSDLFKSTNPRSVDPILVEFLARRLRELKDMHR
jgi:hypothetical protein